MTWRSLRPLACTMRMMFCALSISPTLSRTTSLARKPFSMMFGTLKVHVA
ncbi:MAG: hypothetical protein L0Y50_04055 [Beijerinckiaceae bacterium]|nr:hypothetical protein [Beijerinckiaceae bacterium]